MLVVNFGFVEPVAHVEVMALPASRLCLSFRVMGRIGGEVCCIFAG